MPDKLWGKDHFPQTRRSVYLDTAAEGIPPAAAGEALERYWEHKSMGSLGRKRLYETEWETTALAAGLLGAATENIALLGNASDALNALAASIDWAPGDEVVIMDLEFPSNVLPWLNLKRKGVEVNLVRSRNGGVHLEDFLALIRPRTRLVTVSQVSYKSGAQIPFLAELARAAHSVGALFCVDATQALGRVPVSVEGVDYLVASSYKWTLGCHGVGVVYLDPDLRQRMIPPVVGWYSVDGLFREDRFEAFDPKPGAGCLVTGMPNFPGIYALQAGLRHICAAGPAEIERRLRPLVARLRAGLEERGYELLTPAAPEAAAGIVAFAHPAAEQLGADLAERGVIVWAGDGRVRASIHLYNDASDIEAYLDALDAISPPLRRPLQASPSTSISHAAPRSIALETHAVDDQKGTRGRG